MTRLRAIRAACRDTLISGRQAVCKWTVEGCKTRWEMEKDQSREMSVG
jgi:hypothetical protein